MLRFFVLASIIYAATFVPNGSAAVPAAPASANDAYLLGAEDQLSIHVEDLEEISDKPVRIDPNGFIDLPLVGRIHAADMEVDQLRRVLEERLATYINGPKININVTEFRSQPVSILGSVNNPGVHQLQGPLRLVDVISSAGGLKQDAGPKLTITRQLSSGALPLPGAHADASGKFTVADIAIDGLMKGLTPLNNIEVRSHDVIDISRADIVYVLGEVKKAGGFTLGSHDSISLIRALSMAEGFSKDAAPKKARILRASSLTPGEQEGIPINVREILNGKAPDRQLRADDVLFVPNNVSGSAFRRAMEMALQVGAGVAIYH